MWKLQKIFIILLSITILVSVTSSTIYTNNIECDENTIIISVCTGNMRALETGVAVYAGYNKTPLILSDKTLPEQLDTWLPGYVEKNNITKIIVVGPVTAEQLLNLMKLKVEVKQVNGNNIAEILTKIAENNKEIHKDKIIITSSDPLAGLYGAYTKTPVFITATNSTYDSSTNLDEQYIDYIKENNIHKATIVGNIPESIKNQLKTLNMTLEEISGQNSLEISQNINNKLQQEGYLENSHIAFYGFYGEIPTIIPTTIKENAILIEDSTINGNITDYLKENQIDTVYITRNTESQYIQMEETDYISTDVIKNLENNNITIKYLTKPRTLDEATGLYDMKIITAEYLEGNQENIKKENTTKNIKTTPPLIAILNQTNIIDSNNIRAQIKHENNTDYIVKWNTIHPYTWKKIDENHYYATSNTGYEYYWTREENTWKVQYKYNNKEYYNTTWKENKDNTWTETHQKQEYEWNYDGKRWNCYNQDHELIYYIQK